VISIHVYNMTYKCVLTSSCMDIFTPRQTRAKFAGGRNEPEKTAAQTSHRNKGGLTKMNPTDVPEEDSDDGKSKGHDSGEPPSYWIDSGEGKETVGLLRRAGKGTPFVRLLFQPGGDNRLFAR